MTELPSDKTCPRCTETKPITAFGSDRSRIDGHARLCRPCRNSAIREYRSTPEGRAANKAAWYKSREKSHRALGIT